MGTETDGSGVARQAGLPTGNTPQNIMQFFIDQALSQICTVKIVKVVAVKSAGELAVAGNVDVTPLVSMQDGLGNVTAHETINDVPYMRMQGGKNAIIMDPVVGDLGFIVVADRDSTAAKETKDKAPPSSRRQMDLGDSIYIGGILNDVPEQYIQFTANGIKLADKNGNALESSNTGWKFTGIVSFQNNVQFGGDIKNFTGGIYSGDFNTSGNIISGDINLKTHHHTAQGATAPTTQAQP